MDTLLTFPRLEARSLGGRNLRLPADFAGDWNVAIMAFRQWQQAMVDTWMPKLRELRGARPWLHAYELPMIATPYNLVRPFIDGGMAAAIPSPEVRATTLTIYTNLRTVTNALQISSTETISLFLVDRAGKVVWRGEGEYDDLQLTELKKALEQLGVTDA